VIHFASLNQWLKGTYFGSLALHPPFFNFCRLYRRLLIPINRYDRRQLPSQPCRASMGNALDDPEPIASRQAGAALEHAEPRAKQSVRLLQQ
jgi:hypothetical protein